MQRCWGGIHSWSIHLFAGAFHVCSQALWLIMRIKKIIKINPRFCQQNLILKKKKKSNLPGDNSHDWPEKNGKQLCLTSVLQSQSKKGVNDLRKKSPIAPLFKHRPHSWAGGTLALSRLLFSHGMKSVRVALIESQTSAQSVRCWV